MAKKKIFQISNALAEGLEETVSAAHHYSGALRIEAISLKKIELDSDNPRDLILTFEDLYQGIDKSDINYQRKLAEKASLFTLANSIKEQGIINPIVVYKRGDKYQLVAGERRTLASTLAGKSEIQAKILDSKPDELKISLLQWMENVERKDLSLWERMRNLEKILSSFAESNNLTLKEVTATDLGRMLGCSLPHAMNYMAVLNAKDSIKQLIQQHKIKNLEKAALIAGVKSETIMQQAVDACINGATLKKIKSIVAQEKPQKVTPIISRLAPSTNRGRQTLLVNLGSTKNPSVARLIFDSMLNNEKLTHLKQHFTELNWTDVKSINHAFRQVLRTLEKIEA